jgi:hypothetical protein
VVQVYIVTKLDVLPSRKGFAMSSCEGEALREHLHAHSCTPVLCPTLTCTCSSMASLSSTWF